MSIQAEGYVEAVKERCILVNCNSNIVYVPKSICALNFHIGDAVVISAEPWDYKRLPPDLHQYNIRHRATAIYRNDSEEELINEEGSVSKILKNRGLLIRFGKDLVYCPPEVAASGIHVHDIIRYEARKWDNPPIHLEDIDVRYKCISTQFLREARTELATGTFRSIDSSGNFGIAEGRLMDGSLILAHVDVKVVKPDCADLRKIFPNDAIVKFKAIEQGSHRKNGNIHWQAVVATNERYLINNDNSITLDPLFDDYEDEETDMAALQETFAFTDLKDNTHNVTHSHTAAPNVESSSLEEDNLLCSEDSASNTPYDASDLNGSKLQEQNLQLKMLAHYLNNFDSCNYCLQNEQ